MIKNNLVYSQKDRLTTNNIITPAGIVYPSISGITFGNNTIKFSVTLKDGVSRNFYSQPHKFISILFLYEPKNLLISKYTLTVFQKEFNLHSSGTFEVELAGNSAQTSKYKSGLLFSAAVLVQVNKKKNYWTSTLASEVQL